MNRTFNLESLRPGDRVVLPKSRIGLVQHHAIYIGKDQSGNRIYIENAVGRGVQLISESYLFRDGFKLIRIEPYKGSQHQRSAVVKAALKMVGKKYDLINFNCEHYANSVQHGKSYSSQISVAMTVGLLVLAGFGFYK